MIVMKKIVGVLNFEVNKAITSDEFFYNIYVIFM